MDSKLFDELVQALTTPASRRRAGGLVAALAVVWRPAPGEAKGKKKITLCHQGQTISVPKKKGKAHLKHGDTPGPCPPPACTPNCGARQCGDDGCGKSCGSCGAGQSCNASGQCACPANQAICDGACFASDRICGDICCPEAVECFEAGCACEDFLCSCAAGAAFCSTPDFTQCCAAGDTCDPYIACVTDTCTASNDICTVGAAFCGADANCLCTVDADDQPVCADVSGLIDLGDCPAVSACDTNADCPGAGEVCIDLWCCGDGQTPFRMCAAACPAARHRGGAERSRIATRRRLDQLLASNALRKRA